MFLFASCVKPCNDARVIDVQNVSKYGMSICSERKNSA
jgi:hypothetical protein